jgi:ribosomal protein L24E
MPRVYVCQQGSCRNEETPITVTVRRDETVARFCSYRCLALWAVREEGWREQRPQETGGAK